MSAEHPDAGGAGETVDDLPEQMRIRRAKYDRLMADPDRAPFPASVARTHGLNEIRERFPDLAAGAETEEFVGITGRVIFVRNTGRLCFATLREGGVELQVMLSAAKVDRKSVV